MVIRMPPRTFNQKSDVVDAIRQVATELGHPPSRAEFLSRATTSEYQVLRHFPSWREAVRSAGLEPDATNVRLEDETLLRDWASLVRRDRHIPTRHLYRQEDRFSPGAFEKHFGPWSGIPSKFRAFAGNDPEWADVVALLPIQTMPQESRADIKSIVPSGANTRVAPTVMAPRYTRLNGIPTYGDPIDFRGLRHEPVNEQGVVFLFGMVAKELGYMVEAVQTGYPDCEAKRQIGPGKWQRVRIEFEYESRNFRDHGHPVEGCDVIVCWRHNWKEFPESLEILELRSVIKNLASQEDL